MEESDFTRKIYSILLASFVILAGFMCKILSSVFLPVITAALIACVFAPMIQKINYKFKIPWTLLAVLITVFLLVIILAVTSLLISSVTSILSEYPKY